MTAGGGPYGPERPDEPEHGPGDRRGEGSADGATEPEPGREPARDHGQPQDRTRGADAEPAREPDTGREAGPEGGSSAGPDAGRSEGTPEGTPGEAGEAARPGRAAAAGAEPAPDADAEGDPEDERAPAAPPSRRPGLVDLLRPKATRAQLAVGVLCLLLGFAAAVQVRSNRSDSTFATARQDELVGVLDNLSQRSLRLRSDIRELEETRSQLERDSRGNTAVEEARRRATTYGLLAGTVPAAGPGIELTISDPGRRIRAAVLLDALQELRDAGAEVVQINDVRVGVNTYFLDTPGGGVSVDRTAMRPPYRFLVIGEPRTLAAALDIPGGVMETLRNSGATGRVTQRTTVEIHAVRSPGAGRAGPGD